MNKLTKFRKKIAKNTGHTLVFYKANIFYYGGKDFVFKDYYYYCKTCQSKFWFYAYSKKKYYKYVIFKDNNSNYFDHIKITTCNEVIIKNILE